MTQQPTPTISSPARLTALRRSGLLEGTREEIFDRLLEVAAAVLMAPVALVSVVDEAREVVKSSIGLPESLARAGEIPLAESFSALVVERGEPLLIQNARSDPSYSGHPAAMQSVVAYIGVPLLTRDGHALGTICALDAQPRIWSEQHVRILSGLAGAIMAEVERRMELRGREALQEQFRQAQKMEAVGRLAGGIAHDFNNLLTAISGFAQILRQDTDAADPRAESIEEILGAAERAASLTGQILAFSRRQVLVTQPLDLNHLVAGLGRMLGRVLGSEVRLITSLDPALRPVLGDAGQIEQVLVNLAVNASDAMPGGGTLRIETANATLGEEQAERAYHVRRGEYVRLRVTDTGTGIDAATLEHIFDPFFTTKEPGKGTGLGLSTVYGIVKQSGGYIWAASEPGVGTSFEVFLPVASVESTAAEAAQPTAPAPPACAGEATVLVVEPEAPVRRVMRRVLERGGHRVLDAADGDAALHIAAAVDGPIHALVTDRRQPGTSGPDLAGQMLRERPHLRVLYLSGVAEYEPNNPAPAGSEAVLQKPFTPDALLDCVRRLLESPEPHG